MIKSIIIFIIILYTTKLHGVELSKYEFSGLKEAKKVLFGFKPEITTQDAKIWKKQSITGWDLVAFFEAANKTFNFMAKDYPYAKVDSEKIYFLQPGYIISKNLTHLVAYEKLFSDSRNRFINNHSKFLNGRLFVIPNEAIDTQVIIVKKSHPKEDSGFLKVKVVGDDIYFWTVQKALL